ARNGHDLVTLVQQPCKRDLCGSRLVLHSDLPDDGNRPHVRIKIRALKARIAPAEITFRIFIRALHCAGKESPAQRAERNEADAEMTQQRDDARLEVALPQRILALQCRYRVHGMSAPYGLLTRFRKSEKANLAGVHEISHRADDVLDRDRRIDAVLIQQVYMICLQTTE